MKRLLNSVRAYLYDVSIDINERLGVFFVNIGILAAILGVAICLLAHEPVIGTIAVALIAIGAPLIIGVTRHSQHPNSYGLLIAILVIFMIPLVWLTTGAESGGSGFWFLFELLYITLFTNRKERIPLYVAAILVIVAALAADMLNPELFFHFTNRAYAFVSKIGSGVVVTIETMLMVIVQKALYTYERERNTQSEDNTRNFVTSIANTIDTKDPYTGGHSRRVAECAAAIALNLGMSQTEANNVYFVGLLHDIGKIGIPDAVLNKPGRLTPEETALIRRHPSYGAEILKDITSLPHVHDGVLYHHEHYDGTGYPAGLKGEEIPYVARIISVADAYDAMSTTRVYRKFIKREDIIKELVRCSGTQFDPHIADVFVGMLRSGYEVNSTEIRDVSVIETNLEVAASMMMRRIMENSQLSHVQSGSTNVDSTEFSNLFDYLQNLCRRYGIQMLLTEISLNVENAGIDGDQLLACVADLHSAITKNIRSVDICTRYHAASFMVLLLNAPEETMPIIMGRIRKEFYRLCDHQEITITNSVVQITEKTKEP